MINSTLPAFPKRTLVYAFVLIVIFASAAALISFRIAKEIQHHQIQLIELYDLCNGIQSNEDYMDIALVSIYTSVDYYYHRHPTMQDAIQSIDINKIISKDENIFGFGELESRLYHLYLQHRGQLLLQLKSVEKITNAFNQHTTLSNFQHIDRYILKMQERMAFDEVFFQNLQKNTKSAIDRFNKLEHFQLRQSLVEESKSFKDEIKKAYQHTVIVDEAFMKKASFFSFGIIFIIAVILVILLINISKWIYQIKQTFNDIKNAEKKQSSLAEGRLEILRQIANDLVLSEQRERDQFAKSLHDDLQPLLAAARLRLGSLGVNADSKSDQEKISSILEQAIQQSRQMMLHYNPPCLLGDDLPNALTWLQRWFLQTHQFELKWNQLDLLPRLSKEQELFIFYSVKEFCLNTIKHGKILKAEGKIKIGNGYLMIHIHDDGQGFDLNKLEKSELYQSYGLKNIENRISFWGGRLTLRSEEGEGFDVELYLPLEQGSSSQSNEFGQFTPKPKDPYTCQPEQMKLLIVEDNEKFRAEVVDLLTKAGIFVVGQATTGPQAVEMAKALEVEVILMDITLPGFNGIQATKEILAHHPHLIIIGFSMYDEQDMGVKIKEAGAKDYLQKGVDGLALCACLWRNWHDQYVKTLDLDSEFIDD